MNSDPFYLWGTLFFFVLLVFSAFFSSTETALFSLTRSQIENLQERKDAASKRLRRLLDHPRRLLIVLLSGNTIVNILAASIVALMLARLFGQTQWSTWLIFLIQVVGVTLVLLIMGEILPKMNAIRNPLIWSLRMSGPITAAGVILSPIVAILLPFTDFIARALGVEKRRLWISEQEIKTLVEIGEEHGELEKSEKELIHSIFEFGDTTVREIMIPRTDMICLSADANLQQVLSTIYECGHSRIPVYEDSIDNVIGILYAKDLLNLYPFEDSFELKSHLREPIFVPEGKLIHELLKQFQTQRVHMTIAVDEYGGTAGLVTFEDVIEEIVGEIHDEHDAEQSLWTRIDEQTVVADARVDVETVNEILGTNVVPTDKEFETLGGFLLVELGDFPEAGTQVKHHNFVFTIEEVHQHRLGRIRIEQHESIGGTVEG